MANVSFGTVELSTLGFSVRGINGRAMAAWEASRSKVLGRDIAVDLSGGFDASTKTTLLGSLTAPTEPWNSHTHANFLVQLDALKAALDPEYMGFQKLTITGDRATHFRWARYTEMALSEDYPVFKMPFSRIGLEFDNLEPFWRVAHAPVASASVPLAIPNAGRKTRPIITLAITGAVPNATTPVLLFSIAPTSNLSDVSSFYWQATTPAFGSTTVLASGDTVTIDADSGTVIHDPTGASLPRDAIRAFSYLRAINGGFPVIERGGSTITAKHASVGTITVNYDELYT